MTTLDQQLIAPIATPLLGRNTLLDKAFYDVGKLSAAELGELDALGRDGEGAILVMEPAGSSRPLRHYPNAGAYLASPDRDTKALVVAGVGSSAIGTAALARNVADAYGHAVAGVVTGFGLSDLMTEALGGWFFYGALDRLRAGLRRAIAQMESWKAASTPATRGAPATRSLGFDDLLTLGQVLAAAPDGLRLVVGHSKGCLLLDAVLEQLATTRPTDPLWDRLHVATLGAVVDLPPAVRHAHQFLGSLDWFGGLNSRRDVPHTRIAGAWHHLNTSAATPFHMDAEAVLREHVVLPA